MVDAHVHFAQTGFYDGRPDALDLTDTINFTELQSYIKENPERYYEAYLRSGVTAVYDVGGFEWSIKLQSDAESNLNAPHVSSARPLLSPVPDENLAAANTPDQKQLINLSSPEFGRKKVKQYTALGSTGIKIWQIALRDSTFMTSLKAVADEVGYSGEYAYSACNQSRSGKRGLAIRSKSIGAQRG